MQQSRNTQFVKVPVYVTSCRRPGRESHCIVVSRLSKRTLSGTVPSVFAPTYELRAFGMGIHLVRRVCARSARAKQDGVLRDQLVTFSGPCPAHAAAHGMIFCQAIDAKLTYLATMER